MRCSITGLLSTCCFAFYNNTINVTLFVQKDKLPKCLLTAQSMHKMPEVFQHAVYVLLQYCLSENPSYDLASCTEQFQSG